MKEVIGRVWEDVFRIIFRISLVCFIKEVGDIEEFNGGSWVLVIVIDIEIYVF